MDQRPVAPTRQAAGPLLPAGIDTPTNHPGIFAEGIISTRDDEFGGDITDNEPVFLSKSVLRIYLDVICFSQYKDGRWQQHLSKRLSPGVMQGLRSIAFSDGTKMIFTSSRPVRASLDGL